MHCVPTTHGKIICRHYIFGLLYPLPTPFPLVTVLSSVLMSKRPFLTVKSIRPASWSSSHFVTCFPFKMAFLDWVILCASWALAWWGTLLFHKLSLCEYEPRNPEASHALPPAFGRRSLKELELITAHFSRTPSSAAFIQQHFLIALYLWPKFWKCSNSTGLSFGYELESLALQSSGQSQSLLH